MTGLISLVLQARKVGLVLDKGEGGRLIVRGDRKHEHLVRQLLARKTDVLTLVDLFTGRRPTLDWSLAKVGDQPGRCVLCRGWAILRDPYDSTPCHKVCVEQQLAPEVTP